MTRVAILGSCITRDLWPRQSDAPGDLLYVSRTSLASLMAPPLSGFRPRSEPPGGLRRNPHSALVADLRKTALSRLVAFGPTHLIFDFIDERFDLLAAGGTVVTESWELTQSGYLQQPAFKGARRIPRLSKSAGDLWRTGAADLMGLIRATPLGRARLILHSARWAAEIKGGGPLQNVEILPGKPADIAAHNALLSGYETHVELLAPAMDVVAAPDQRIADRDHPWGLSPFHYSPGYYAAIWDQLVALGVQRP